MPFSATDRLSFTSCVFLLASVMGVSDSLAAASASKPASTNNENKAPAFISADTMRYDQQTQDAIASGHVEIMQDDRIILADEVVYNKQKNTVTATGNVSMMEKDGNVFFASRLDIKDDMKTAVISHFRARMTDGSLLAANSATRVGTGKTVLKKAVYSPCPICKERAPQWQIKSGTVTIDEPKQKITYRNAFFETYGVPILYTPYFSHATPGADRKSGLLTPTYSSITSLGSTIKLPYYVNIAPNMDATLTPFLTSSQGPVMIGEFRHLTKTGTYELTGSITNPPDYRVISPAPTGNQIRGHIEGQGTFALEDNWVSGFAIKRASDDTYLRRYKFSEEDYLTSRIFAERREDRDYVTMQGLAFQDLRAVSIDSTPVVLPLIDSHLESDPGFSGSRWKLDSDIAAITRGGGTDSRRLSVTGSWNLPYVTQGGHVLGLTTSLRGDGYFVNDVAVTDRSGSPSLYNGGVSRLVPESRFDWRYPLIAKRDNISMLIEPIANVILSPYGSNPQEIPNEDSLQLELMDTNLFSSNRFAGFDRIETGPRANYGVQSNIEHEEGGSINMLFGQSYRPRPDNLLVLGSGMEDRFSDYVGKIEIHPNGILDLAYHFRMDKEDLSLHRNDVNSVITLYPFALNVGYISFNQDIPGGSFDRQEIYGGVSTALSKKWTISANGRRNLADNGGLIATGTTLLYTGDCLDFNTSMVKQYTEDRDIKPSTSFTVQLFLKNLTQTAAK
jgi:LPS-assembly protein